MVIRTVHVLIGRRRGEVWQYASVRVPEAHALDRCRDIVRVLPKGARVFLHVPADVVTRHGDQPWEQPWTFHV